MAHYDADGAGTIHPIRTADLGAERNEHPLSSDGRRFSKPDALFHIRLAMVPKLPTTRPQN
jgi:hypothetical protein